MAHAGSPTVSAQAIRTPSLPSSLPHSHSRERFLSQPATSISTISQVQLFVLGYKEPGNLSRCPLYSNPHLLQDEVVPEGTIASKGSLEH